MTQKLLILFALASFVAGCAPKSEETSSNTPAQSGGEIKFASIQPLIQQKCMACHGENGKHGIDMRTYESLMKGGEDGPIVKPGDPENSQMVQALRGTHGMKQMPMKQPPLSEEDIKQIEDWIKAGAKA